MRFCLFFASSHDLRWVRGESGGGEVWVEISQEKVGQISKVASFWEVMGKDVHLGAQRRKTGREDEE